MFGDEFLNFYLFPFLTFGLIILKKKKRYGALNFPKLMKEVQQQRHLQQQQEENQNMGIRDAGDR